ncbi:MAG TPA: tetratricopeptide repeat protein [Candidatus Methylacidiphilales bacterium]|nr:tetratricopeptide repeat protein [Candidatus Methylacidiphilales bacterium]
MEKRVNTKKPIGPTIIFPGSFWALLSLVAVTFLAYWPSLKSDFVYDARIEILQEGFITSLSNLPAVLSLKVLGMNLMLADRPGQILYLMLNAAFWGKDPWGYHLGSNLLHAANAALLFVFLRRLAIAELSWLAEHNILRTEIAIGAVTLIFALHPIAVEPVSGINFSSDLLVTFFTLLALLAATVFRVDHFGIAVGAGGVGTLCSFLAVSCKESGIAAALLLIIYWFLFRRQEAKVPWLLFLGAAASATAAFLATRFLLAAPGQAPLGYLGGSLSQVFLLQPRLWVFMMGKLLWPAGFSADYTLQNLDGMGVSVAWPVLVVVILLQGWLAMKSRLGAMGVAIYWLGLATVSNFMPLHRALADRFYYLPLTGVAAQLLALLLMTLKSRFRFWLATGAALAALLPLTLLTLAREEVFTNDLSLWADTLRVSPFSVIAYNNYGLALGRAGRLDEAISVYQKALTLNSNFPDSHNNLAWTLLQKGELDGAITQCQRALEIDPHYADAHENLGVALFKKGDVEHALAQFQQAAQLDPGNNQDRENLAGAEAVARRLQNKVR